MPSLWLIVIKGVKVQRVAAGSAQAEKELLSDEEAKEEEEVQEKSISLPSVREKGGNADSNDLTQRSGFCEWEPFSRLDL